MHVNPYQSPSIAAESIVHHNEYTEDNVLFLVLARLLMIGAGLWGATICFWCVLLNPLWGLLVFGPGYFVTVGYIWRGCFPCDWPTRKVLWGLSAIVQGAFLTLAIAYGLLFNLVAFWWLFSVTISIAGLVYDGRWNTREIAG